MLDNTTFTGLLVEDDPDDVLLMQEMLREAGDGRFTLEEAGTLQEALRAIPSRSYDVLVVDLCLPDSWGIETFVEIQKHAPELPIIVLSGMDDERFAVEAVSLGAQDYLVKGRTDGVLLVRALRHSIERNVLLTQLRQATQDAEAAGKAKGVFLANMSHEIRTPMNIVVGMTELALNTPLTAEQAEHLGMVRTAAHSLLSVINDILDWSKIESGTIALDASEFGLHSVLENTMGGLEIIALEKGLSFTWSVQPDVPDAVVGDPGRLRQVLNNLVGNAIKFTDRGAVGVDIRLEGPARGGKSMIHVLITDTGIGIPADKHDTVFEPFEQADSASTRKHGGTGLGLGISSQLVNLMGGRLWFESEVGVGSTFHFTALLAAGKASSSNLETGTATHALAVPAVAGEPGLPSILVVEDDPDNRKLISLILERRGHAVATACNGVETLSRIKEERFDLLLMDVQMPEMDGFQTTHAIRREEEATGGHLPIIALTAHALLGDRDRCLEAGMDDYITKPINQDDLFRAIDNNAPCRPQVAGETIASDGDGDASPDLEMERQLRLLAASFLSKTGDAMETMAAALATGDCDAIGRIGHRLAGSAASFGFQEITDLGRSIERAASDADLRSLRALLRDLGAELGRAA